MSGFKLSFDTDNDAFDDDYGAETARILREVAAKIERGYDSAPVFDINGNRVGSYSLTEEAS